MLTDHRPHGDGLVGFGFIRELGGRGHVLHVAAGQVDLSARLPANVCVHELGLDERSPRIARLRYIHRLRRLYRQLSRSISFDLIHQLTPVDVGASLALPDARVPVVLGPYVPDWAPSGEGADAVVGPVALRVKHLLRAAQQRRASTVLLATPAAQAKLALRRPGPHVRELPLGVDERAWFPAANGAGGEGVLFLANLEIRKGIHVMLDAFARVVRELPSARLVIAGAGPEADAVRRRVGACPALKRVELVGQVDPERARAAMQACDVYCLPSFGDPNPLAVLQAMACGRPVVATDAGGIPHLLPDRGGRKVPPGDPEALAAALRELLADPGMRRSMGEHNRTLVEDRYAWARVVDRLEDIYDETLSDFRARAR